jgi:hypothetical protein
MTIKRPIDVEKLGNEQLEIAISKISNQITSDVDATCEKANELLSRYGLKCKMAVVIEELELLAE